MPKLGALLAESEAEYRKDPKDLTVQYEYFYALWLNRWENNIDYSVKETDDMAAFSFATLKLRYPRTYNYTRLAALCSDSWGFQTGLLPFLQRLLRQDPGDFESEYYYPVMLATTSQPGLQLQAIQLADALEKQYPDIAVVHVAAGYAYYRRWTTTKDPAIAKEAIDEYQAFLDHTTPNGYFNSTAEFVIREIEKG